MRFLLSVSLGLIAGLVHADRILNVPTGRTMGLGTFRAEYLYGLNNRGAKEQFIGFSPVSSLDIELRNRFRFDDPGNLTADVSYNYVAPVPSISPGISFGVLDASNRTLDGRRGFVAITFREALDIGQVSENGDFTIGMQFGGISSGFMGVALPLSGRTKFLFEHNGARLTGGIESNLIKGLNLRVFTQENLLLGGLSYAIRF
jgi:hypothetical protein